MAWNEPGNKGKDPWGNNGKNQGPPDLDEVFKTLSNKFGGIFGGGGKNSGGISGVSLVLLLAIVSVIWFASGFYTIKEAERGVVLRLGKFHQEVIPGLHWQPTFIDRVLPVDIESIRSLQAAGFMLTRDENVVRVEMNVQYRVVDPYAYLFNTTMPTDSLSQAVDSALRYVIGHTTMDDILTTGREVVRQQTRTELLKITEPYKLGLEVVDVNFLPARPPEEVKGAFDDAIAAQEDEERYVREAEAYALSIEPQARGQVRRLEQQASAYKEQVILKAQGEIARFEKLLPEYVASKEVTRERLYLETIERVYGNTTKVMVDVEGGNNMIYLPLDKIMQQSQTGASRGSSLVPSATSSGVSNDPKVDIRSFNRDATRQGRN